MGKAATAEVFANEVNEIAGRMERKFRLFSWLVSIMMNR